MHVKANIFLIAAVLAAALSGCERGAPPPTPATAPAPPEAVGTTAEQAPQVASRPVGDYQELDWDTLIPPEWRPDEILDRYAADELSDDDPRAQAMMAELKTFWDEAPVVPDLDGRSVRLPGFIIPLEMTETGIQEFLLVPYYGACIHVPPPPANQTVHVVTEAGSDFVGALYDTVWVNGRLRVQQFSNDLADAGYQIQDAWVTPYE